MAWLRKNVGWIVALVGLAGSAGGVWIKAALADTTKAIADTNSRVSVLEAQRHEDKEQRDRIEKKLDHLIDIHISPERQR